MDISHSINKSNVTPKPHENIEDLNLRLNYLQEEVVTLN